VENNRVLGLLGLATRAGKTVWGTDACIEYMEKNRIKLILVAKDSSERLRKKFSELCEKKNINFFEFSNVDEISNAIGKHNKAVIGVKDINFSNEIIKIINGGEVIG